MVLCRRLLVALLGLSAVLWANPGLAQTGGTGGTAGIALTTTDFTLTLQQQNADLSYSDLSQADAATYLNHARCQCATPVQIVVQMATASVSKLSTVTQLLTQARLYVGDNCAQLNSTGTGPQCLDSQMLGEINGITTLSQGPGRCRPPRTSSLHLTEVAARPKAARRSGSGSIRQANSNRTPV